MLHCRNFLLLLALITLVGCSSSTTKVEPSPAAASSHNETSSNYDLASASNDTPEDEDPWEGFNRAMFGFNDTLDIYLLEPVAKGYDYVLPSPAKIGVSNFFDNLRHPLYVFSSLFQAKFTQGLEQTGRFLLNSTAGILGLVDVAKHAGLNRHEEDLGTMFASWGIDSGPYLVLPFLGPSYVRETVGRIGDRFLNPTYYIASVPISVGVTALEVVDDRRKLIDAIDAGKKGSLDYYVFVRNSYKQRRQSLIFNGNPPSSEAEPFDPLDDPELSK
jgi:phospholipid-binding lipoprotein MlaA